MRISDWSSDVCSSDLMLAALEQHFAHATNCPSGCDLAIFSRWPIIGSDYFLKDAAGRKFGPALLWARIAPPAGEAFMVATLHYPRPTSRDQAVRRRDVARALARSEEHTSELQSLMRISYAVFCLKKKKKKNTIHNTSMT